MVKLRNIVFGMMLLLAASASAGCSKDASPKQYFFLNDHHFSYDYERINEVFGPQNGKDPAVGEAILIYLLHNPLEEICGCLESHFELSEKYDIPVFVELDPISFWDDVPWIWNWYDPEKPGYNPENRENVEWYGWSSEYAVKIGWLNWGRQIRLDPMANLFSPVYQAEVRKRMTAVLDLVEKWYKSLPRSRKYLLGGIKLTGEMGFGFNNWYYPDGNSYYGRPDSEDPQTGVRHFEPPTRGVAQIGYAALTYSGLKTSGEITDEDIFAIEREFLSFIVSIASEFSFPRELLYLHSIGAMGDIKACIQPGACPSWTSYWERAQNPTETDYVRCTADMEPPCWGLAEWNIGSEKTKEEWAGSLSLCFSLPKLRFITLFNIDSVINPDGTVYEPAVKAIESLQEEKL